MLTNLVQQQEIHLQLLLLKEIMVVLHLVVIGKDLVVVVELQRLE